jgi:hypothetical protein
MVLAGEPADLADLAEEGGGQYRPHPEQLDQAHLGLDDGGLDTPFDGGDPLLQLTDVSDQLDSELMAGDRWGISAAAGNVCPDGGSR